MYTTFLMDRINCERVSELFSRPVSQWGKAKWDTHRDTTLHVTNNILLIFFGKYREATHLIM